jgi:DNA-binding CsgD family transcriptional regulator
VQALCEAGLSGAEIARRLGISKSTVSYHKRRLGQPIDARCNRR